MEQLGRRTHQGEISRPAIIDHCMRWKGRAGAVPTRQGRRERMGRSALPPEGYRGRAVRDAQRAVVTMVAVHEWKTFLQTLSTPTPARPPCVVLVCPRHLASFVVRAESGLLLPC